MGGGGSWKVAYADFVTAMMAFFLLMWILAMVPKDKLVQISGYFKAPGGYDTNSPTSINAPPITAPQDPSSFKVPEGSENNVAIAKALKGVLEESGIATEEAATSNAGSGVLLRVTGNAMFAPNSVELSPTGKRILDRVIKVMKEFKVYLVVRGHSSANEDGRPLFASKWELSAARSTAAVRYIIEQGGIDPRMIMSVAFADTRPQVPDSANVETPQNRRVEFYFHKPDVASNIMGY